MTPERQNISSKNIQQLLQELKTGALSPVEVLEAFQAKALQVDKEINAVCDFILSAGDWAQYLATVPECERGPLFGLPISVKVSGRWRQQSNLSDCLMSGVFLCCRTRHHHRAGSVHRPAGPQGLQLCPGSEGAPRRPLLSDQRAPDHDLLRLQQPGVRRDGQPARQDENPGRILRWRGRSHRCRWLHPRPGL